MIRNAEQAHGRQESDVMIRSWIGATAAAVVLVLAGIGPAFAQDAATGQNPASAQSTTHLVDDAQPAQMAASAQDAAADATSSSEASYQVEIGISKSQVIDVPGPYTDLMVADPKIADVVPLTGHSINIVGKAPGATALSIFGPGKRLIAIVDVVVGADIDGFKERLHEVLPNERDVSARSANQSLLISGTVSNAVAAQQVLALADTYSPGKVVNMLGVEGTQQVMLSVRFVEMERTSANRLGLNVNRMLNAGATENPAFSLNTGLTLASAAASATNTFGQMALLFQSGSANLDVLVDALETKGAVKTLAEPSLVAMSGDTASFLAGGEFPVPVAETTSTGVGSAPLITIEFKQFGISLAFTPTILQDGMINLVVNPEVSSIDQTNAIVENGLTIPGIKIRKAHTTVELRDGESFTIAGLLGDSYTNTINAFPFAGDLPVLGALFRSTQYQRDQTELVIIVTPHLVVPTRGPLALPTDQFVPPSDLELFLFGMQTGRPSDVAPEDRVLISQDPTKGGVEGPFGHVLY
jgi:pilus assembly protein CpaC